MTTEGEQQRETGRTIECSRACEIPEGTSLYPVPRPRHAWADVIVCPYEDCGAAFLVSKDDAAASGSSYGRVSE